MFDAGFHIFAFRPEARGRRDEKVSDSIFGCSVPRVRHHRTEAWRHTGYRAPRGRACDARAERGRGPQCLGRLPRRGYERPAGAGPPGPGMDVPRPRVRPTPSRGPATSRAAGAGPQARPGQGLDLGYRGAGRPRRPGHARPARPGRGPAASTAGRRQELPGPDGLAGPDRRHGGIRGRRRGQQVRRAGPAGLANPANVSTAEPRSAGRPPGTWSPRLLVPGWAG
jgi:hypothetical protein